MTRPIVMGERVLPIKTIVQFDHEKHKIFYWTMFANQLLNAFFAGGADFAINWYLYFMIICIEFAVNLLGCRLKRFGHKQMKLLTKRQKLKDYRDLVELIKYHIEAAE